MSAGPGDGDSPRPTPSDAAERSATPRGAGAKETDDGAPTAGIAMAASSAGKDPVELLRRRVRELQLLHETGQRLTSFLNVGDVLSEMVGQLRHVLGVEIVSVMLLDRESEELRIQAASGLPRDVVTRARVALGEGISGQVAARGEAVLVRDVSREQRFARSSFHAQYTTESLLCVPLKVGERVLGVVNVNNKIGGDALDENDLALVTTFSAQAALALENSRLYGNLEQEVERVTGELKRSNEDLRRLQEFSDSILRQMSSGMLVLGMDERVSRLNPAGRRILGLPIGAELDVTLETLFGDEGARQIRHAREGEGDRERREVLVRTREGRDALIGYSKSSLLDGRGRRIGLIVIFRDLTELKKMEQELIRMDRLASLGVLGAGLAHEIRNPLAAIRFNLDFLAESGEVRPELAVIAKNVQRLDELVRKLLRFARPQPPSFSVQQVGPRVEAVAALIAKQAQADDVRVETRLDDSLPLVRIDGAQVEQVILNIALNGLQHMPSGGTLLLETRAGRSADGEATEVQIAIHDEGTGLSPEQARQIFDPFFTTREGGTGLGLTVAHRIVQDHGGSIAVEPTPADRRGTTFVVSLPAASEG